MSANMQAKQVIIDDIHDKFAKAQSAVLVDYIGLTVEEVTALRSEFRKVGVEYKVLKNTLIHRATMDMGYEGLDAHLEGPTAVAFSYEDPTAAARVITDFIKKYKKTTVKCGIVSGKVLDADGVDTLAKIPSREVLLAQLMSVFNGPVRGIVVAVNAIREKLENGAAEA